MIDITFKNISGEEAAKLSDFYEKIKNGSEYKVAQQPVTFTPGYGAYSAVPTQQMAAPAQVPVTGTTSAVPTTPAVTAQPAVTAPAAVPTTTVPEYTIDQLQIAIAPLLDSGKAPQIQQLVQSFGVSTLTEIPKERYGELANGLRSLGGVL